MRLVRREREDERQRSDDRITEPRAEDDPLAASRRRERAAPEPGRLVARNGCRKPTDPPAATTSTSIAASESATPGRSRQRLNRD